MGQQSFKLKTKEDTYNICLSLLGEHQIKKLYYSYISLRKVNEIRYKNRKKYT